MDHLAGAVATPQVYADKAIAEFEAERKAAAAAAAEVSSIIIVGSTYHGISIDSRGVFTNDEDGTRTYAGQCKDGYACGLGVATSSDGVKVYAEHGPDGQCDGRWLDRYADGSAGYILWERGKAKDIVVVYADGHCVYNYVACTPDDPRVLALIAQVAPVEVSPAAPAPTRHSSPTRHPSHRPMDRPARFAPAGAGGRRCHRGAPPFRTPSLVVVRHRPATAAQQSTTSQ